MMIAEGTRVTISERAAGTWREAIGAKGTVDERGLNVHHCRVLMDDDSPMSPGRKAWLVTGWLDADEPEPPAIVACPFCGGRGTMSAQEAQRYEQISLNLEVAQ